MHHEQEAELEEIMDDEKRFTNPAYEGVLVGQFVFEETEIQANGGYSRLNSRMGSVQRKPQLRFVETSALTPHYSSLDLNNGSTANDSGDQRPAVQDPKNHQYEDVDREGDVKISNNGQSHESRKHTTYGLYEDVSIRKQPMQSVNDYTESHNYEEAGGFKQLQVEIEAERDKGEFENQELDRREMQRKEWNGIRNYSNETDNRESLDNMLDSEIEGTCV